jgi:hypothetical protein
MEMAQLLDLILRYATAAAPLFATIAYMYKSQNNRIDILEKRTTDVEKTLIEIRTEFKYTAKDIADIKNILEKMQTR